MMMKRWLAMMAMALSLTALTGCGYNDFQKLDEASKSAWSEVLNQYQRRADLVPNIVASVKGEGYLVGEPQVIRIERPKTA